MLSLADCVEIVTLSADDWELYKNIRLYAVKESPQAFGTTFEEELAMPESEWKRRMGLNMFFAKKKGRIIGMCGAVREQREKLKHHALIISVYVTPEERNKGVATQLLKTLIQKMKSNENLQKLILHVTTEQTEAINLYKKFGFHITGIMENEYRIDGKSYDQYIMSLFL